MRENELKPCPFCGGKAETREYYHYGLGYEHWVKCTICEVRTPGGIDNTEHSEIKIWNRRVDNESRT